MTVTKPFSPLFLNNMKKFGVSTDWLAKRSNSVRQSSYSRSSLKSNTNQLDAMIKSASAKPIRSNRKLSFIENTTPTPANMEIDQENTDPLTESNDKNEESKEITETKSAATPYDLSSEIDEDKENEQDNSPSPTSKEFSLRIPRVNLPDEESNRSSKRSISSSSSSSIEKTKRQKTTLKKKRRSKKKTTTTDATKRSSQMKDKDEQATTNNDETKTPSEEKDKDEEITTNNDETKKPSQKKDKNELALARIEHLKKLLRTAGIRLIVKKAELDELPSNGAKIDYLKALFDTAGFTGNLTIKECEKFRKKRDNQKELLEIQANVVDVKGHVKGGRTLRGQARDPNESDLSLKRKRTASSEIEDNDDDEKNNNNSSDDEKPIVKKRRVIKMEASPEVSDNE